MQRQTREPRIDPTAARQGHQCLLIRPRVLTRPQSQLSPDLRAPAISGILPEHPLPAVPRFQPHHLHLPGGGARGSRRSEGKGPGSADGSSPGRTAPARSALLPAHPTRGASCGSGSSLGPAQSAPLSRTGGRTRPEAPMSGGGGAALCLGFAFLQFRAHRASKSGWAAAVAPGKLAGLGVGWAGEEVGRRLSVSLRSAAPIPRPIPFCPLLRSFPLPQAPRGGEFGDPQGAGRRWLLGFPRDCRDKPVWHREHPPPSPRHRSPRHCPVLFQSVVDHRLCVSGPKENKSVFLEWSKRKGRQKNLRPCWAGAGCVWGCISYYSHGLWLSSHAG